MEALKARAAQGCPHAKAQLEQMAEKAKATVLFIPIHKILVILRNFLPRTPIRK